jgi:hypothetical protein
MLQDGGVREAGELGFGLGQLLGLLPQRGPDGIATRYFLDRTHMVEPSFAAHQLYESCLTDFHRPEN